MLSDLESAFDTYWRLFAPGEPQPEAEYRALPPRRWRIDRAWPLHRVAVELEGGVFSGGRHTRGTGYTADLEKYNALTLAGWRILRYSAAQLHADPSTVVAQIITLLQRQEAVHG